MLLLLLLTRSRITYINLKKSKLNHFYFNFLYVVRDLVSNHNNSIAKEKSINLKMAHN